MKFQIAQKKIKLAIDDYNTEKTLLEMEYKSKLRKLNIIK